MLHLFNTAVNPHIPLVQALKHWSHIALRYVSRSAGGDNINSKGSDHRFY